ncbi:hypothetical protein PoB_005459700 [Plakobranchus ocellatus]|uniref:Uncharacterized protein n=1 Tax=Plakobranchus ocellatus TaxID=259542 RepID=A0AAV4C970_9GAST|nr:hypothetical protein PoB_005459700 [Plakobranchus ocellatus]
MGKISDRWLHKNQFPRPRCTQPFACEGMPIGRGERDPLCALLQEEPQNTNLRLKKCSNPEQGRIKNFRRQADEFLQFQSDNVASHGTKMVHYQHPQVHNFCRGEFLDPPEQPLDLALHSTAKNTRGNRM